METSLAASVQALLRSAGDEAVEAEPRSRIQAIAERLDGPLRVALAGRIKAGKSTLLNALIGEELAPTDAGECTKIVTWYRHGPQAAAFLHPRDGQREPVFFRRDSGFLDFDIGDRRVDDIDHLDITWPSNRLRRLTLIDTPGLASINADLSARTVSALTPNDEPSDVDAVIYLLRHHHPADVRFLESFSDGTLAPGGSVNAVGVLSRADEIGSCRLDAMDVASRVAVRYAADSRFHQLCPVIIPVCGLLAHAAETLREYEFRLMTQIARLPRVEYGELLLTTDRFTQMPSSLELTEIERRHLLGRLGLYGLRLCVELITRRITTTASALARELAARSGLDALRSVLAKQFAERSQILKARSALIALRAELRRGTYRHPELLASRLDRITTNTHAFEEIRLLDELRRNSIAMPSEQAVELERLFGGSGHDAASRLGLPPSTPSPEIFRTALSALDRWRAVADHPLTARMRQIAIYAAIRTLDEILMASRERPPHPPAGEEK